MSEPLPPSSDLLLAAVRRQRPVFRGLDFTFERVVEVVVRVGLKDLTEEGEGPAGPGRARTGFGNQSSR